MSTLPLPLPPAPPTLGQAFLPAYAELQCRSNFSFLEGASHPEALVARAAELGYAALALTDECSVAGVVRAAGEARTTSKERPATLPFIVGSTFRLDVPAQPRPGDPPVLELVVLCRNRNGYGNLVEMITRARSRAPKGEYRLGRLDIEAPPPEFAHLQGLPDCLVILAPAQGVVIDVLAEQAAWARHVFGDRLWLGLTLLHRAGDEAHRATVDTVAARLGLPVVATGDVRMHLRSCKPLHDLVRAIRLGTTVQAAGYALAPNAEQHLRSRMRLARLYPPDALAQTLVIARQCTFDLTELRYDYPEEIVPAGHTPGSYLRECAYAGAADRYPEGVPARIAQLIEHELELIAEKQYEAYFLTVYDLVRFARSKNILCQGRGSAANSVVCYCLGVTAADPEKTVPLFERFISRERDEPPDIDVDFEHQRREEVIQYVYTKYGRDRAALTAVVSSYRARGCLRDTGKALGVDLAIVDAVAKAQQWWDGKAGLLQRMQEAGLDPASPTAQMWAEMASRLHGFPRHLSQHPGGFVIARDKLSRLVPIENAAMVDRSVVQWDKDDLDAVGLLKVDVLALGMLSVLRRALAMASEQRGRPLGLHQVEQDCGETYAMIQQADTVGTFQIESRAQMSMLPRLRPERYYDLVVQVAIVRPGPIQGDMVHPYLRRRRGQEPCQVPVPTGHPPGRPAPLDAALKRTLGVPIFQEQVMQVAMIAADFTPDRADRLRRAMAAWRRKGGIDRFHDELINGMVANGYDPAFAAAIFRQMEGFGEYGFPESHAASFALLAYASAWLKWHYPQAFLAALLNSQPMGFYSPSQLVQDARRAGVVVLPVDIHHSGYEARLIALDPDAPDGRPVAASASRGDHAPARALAAVLAERSGRGQGRASGSAMPARAAQGGAGRPAPGAACAQAGAARPASDGSGTGTGTGAGSGLSPSMGPGPGLSPGPGPGLSPSTDTDTDAGSDMDTRTDTNTSADPDMGPAPPPGQPPPPTDGRHLRRFGVRLGLNQVKGLSEPAALRIEAAGRARPFTDMGDLAARAALSRQEVEALAAADALHALVGHRRQAAWLAASAASGRDLLQAAEHEASRVAPRLAEPSEAQHIVADYQTLGLTLQRHPVALLRERLTVRGYLAGTALRTLRNGRSAKACGLVVGRQRPGTAKGTVFVTLEDETGPINVIVWPGLVESQRKALVGARLLGVHGEWQHADGVHHLIARQLVDLTAWLGALSPASRDFH